MLGESNCSSQQLQSQTGRGSPAVLVWQPVQGDGSLPAGTPEEALHGVVPPQIVVLVHAAVRRLEVGVATLEAAREQQRSDF